MIISEIRGENYHDDVIPSVERDPAKSPGEKGLLGETKVSFVATDAHSASALREIAFPFGRRPKGCLAMLEMTG